MPMIVAVHGIGQQLKGPNTLHEKWLPALRDGLSFAGFSSLDPEDLRCSFYGDIFRQKDTKASPGGPLFVASDIDKHCDVGFDPDIDSNYESTLLYLWWQAAAETDDTVPGPTDDETKALRAPRVVQQALNALSFSRSFANLAERALIFDLKQVRAYMGDRTTFQIIQDRVKQDISEDTRVLIGHSLGSVVCYEALCAHPEWLVDTLVTLGSPLGIRNLVFDRLRPPPVDAVGQWPGSVKHWVNVADGGDIVALVKSLASRFGDRVHDELIYNGATAHDVRPYLTAKETGTAVAAALATGGNR